MTDKQVTDKRTAGRTALIAIMAASGAEAADSLPHQVYYPQAEQQVFSGPPELFSGQVDVRILFPANNHASFSGALVTFAPGARTAWHEHPAGQHMVVTQGQAITATRTGQVVIAQPHEAVWCPPGTDHWHGATAEGVMQHLVITGSVDGANVHWKELVTDDEYAAALAAIKHGESGND